MERGAHGKMHELFADNCAKIGWTDQFCIWVVDSGGLEEAEVQSYSPGGANVPDDIPWAVQKRLNWSICSLSCELRWAEGSTS